MAVTLQNGQILDFFGGDFRTDDDKIIEMLDRHPRNGKTFFKVEAEDPKEEDTEGSDGTSVEPAPLQEVAEVTTVQQAAEWLATNHDVKGIRSKVGAQQAAETLGFSFPNL